MRDLRLWMASHRLPGLLALGYYQASDRTDAIVIHSSPRGWTRSAAARVRPWFQRSLALIRKDVNKKTNSARVSKREDCCVKVDSHFGCSCTATAGFAGRKQ